MKDKIIKIIKNNFNFTESEIRRVVPILLKEYDLEHPQGGLDEDAIIQLADEILYKEKNMKNKNIVSKVIDKLAKPNNEAILQRASMLWEKNKNLLISKLDKLSPPPVDLKELNNWKREYDILKLSMQDLEEEYMEFLQKNKIEL